MKMVQQTVVTVMAMIFGTAAVRADSLEIDKTRSRIQVDVKATGHAFTGQLGNYTVTAAGDRTTGKPTSLDLAWDFNDLKTGDEKRDKEMVKWLGGGKPQGKFSFQKSWEETTTGGKAQGNLTIHGVSKQLAFPYTVKTEGEWVTVDGKVTIDYQTFKLPLIRTMAIMTVDPALVIRFHLVGKLK